MKETEQTLLEKIKNDVAILRGYDNYQNWKDNMSLKFDSDRIDSFISNIFERYATEKAKEIDYVLDQSYDALRIAANILQSRSRETAADRQIEFAERLVRWLMDGQKGIMPKWIPDHEPEPIKVYFRSQVQASCEATLKKASEKATVRLPRYDEEDPEVNKSSILDPSNIVIVSPVNQNSNGETKF